MSYRDFFIHISLIRSVFGMRLIFSICFVLCATMEQRIHHEIFDTKKHFLRQKYNEQYLFGALNA